MGELEMMKYILNCLYQDIEILAKNDEFYSGLASAYKTILDLLEHPKLIKSTYNKAIIETANGGQTNE